MKHNQHKGNKFRLVSTINRKDVIELRKVFKRNKFENGSEKQKIHEVKLLTQTLQTDDINKTPMKFEHNMSIQNALILSEMSEDRHIYNQLINIGKWLEKKEQRVPKQLKDSKKTSNTEVPCLA